MMLMAASAQQPPKVLEGLKEIAYELGIAWRCDVSVWRAWRYCSSGHDPLPHHKVGRTVCAFSARLAEWAARQPMWRRRA